MRMSRMTTVAMALGVWAVWGQALLGAVIEPNIRYATSGTVGDRGRGGPAAIEFVGMSDAAFYEASSGGMPQMPSPSIPAPGQWSFNIGDFRLVGMTSGTATTYDETPFEIQLRVDGDTSYNFVLGGTLTGTVDPTKGADLLTDFHDDPASPPDTPPIVFQSNGLTHRILGVGDGRLLIRPGGSLTLRSYITPQPVPEPATLLLLSPLVVVIARRLRRVGE